MNHSKKTNRFFDSPSLRSVFSNKQPSHRFIHQRRPYFRRWLSSTSRTLSNFTPNTSPSSDMNIFAETTAMAESFGSVNLGQGFPSFPTPQFIKECAVTAVRENHNQYTRPSGNPFLTQILSDFYSPIFKRDLNPSNEITTSCGAQGGIFNALKTFTNPGDDVLCIEPFFDSYKNAADLVGVRTVGIPLRMATASIRDGKTMSAGDFKLDIDELEASITGNTKLLILNTPHNPTGKVFDKSELEAIACVVRRHPQLIVISDEVYEFMCYDGKLHERFALLNDMFERTVSLSSASKTFSCTGWRVGYSIGPSHLIEPLIATGTVVSYCAPTNNQVAVGLAFKASQESGYFSDLSAMLQKRRDSLCAALCYAGMQTITPEGGYFVLSDTSRIPVTVESGKPRDVAVNKWLTEEIGITGIPTSYFYSDVNKQLSDNVLRFAYCKTDEEIEKATGRLAALPSKLF